MTPEQAVEKANELNKTGKHSREWRYYATYHDISNTWFVMRRRKMAELRVAVYITGEVSPLEK